MILYIFALAFLYFISYTYLTNKNRKNYWAKHGIPFYEGAWGLGFVWELLIGKHNTLFEIADKVYKKYPDVPAIASKIFTAPSLYIKDLENIQQVMAGDFNTFNHRGFDVNGDVDPLSDNVLFMNGIRWKLTRQKLTPLFTSAKLRNMFYIVNETAEDFVMVLRKTDKSENAFNTLVTYCCAAITATVFGIETKSIDMNSPFLKIALSATGNNMLVNLKFILAGFSQKLFNLLKIRLFTEFEDFFIGAIKQVLKIRKESKVRRHDFADLCIDLQKLGTLKDSSTGYEIEPTDELISAQAFFFFIAGVDPSAMAMFTSLFELAKNPTILERVHKHIDELFDQNEGKITYENIVEFEYMDRVIDEAMRMYPPIGVITRKSTKKGTLPVGNIPVDVNVNIQIPAYSIHHDPKYYPDPYKFDPERFTEEAKRKRPNYTYLPFGEGNRMCLGMRLARVQVKTGIVHILRHFTVTTKHGNTVVKFSKNTIQLRPSNIDFDFVERKL